MVLFNLISSFLPKGKQKSKGDRGIFFIHYSREREVQVGSSMLRELNCL